MQKIRCILIWQILQLNVDIQCRLTYGDGQLQKFVCIQFRDSTQIA